MRSGGSQQKGSAFERDVCKKLSLWISHDEREDIFWRSAMSGGRATVAMRDRNTKLSSQAGDISLVDPLGAEFITRFMIECKFYKDLQLAVALTKGKGKLIEFWNVAKEEAYTHGKLPILVAKQNRLPTMVVLPFEWTCDIGVNKVRATLWGVEAYVLAFDDFLGLAPTEVIESTP